MVLPLSLSTHHPVHSLIGLLVHEAMTFFKMKHGEYLAIHKKLSMHPLDCRDWIFFSSDLKIFFKRPTKIGTPKSKLDKRRKIISHGMARRTRMA